LSLEGHEDYSDSSVFQYLYVIIEG